MESAAMKGGKNNEIAWLKSMIFFLGKIVKDGYIESFKATSGGLESANTHKLYTPDQVKVVNFFRFEGFSNPNDNAIMYVIETSDGVKGTLIDSFGGYADKLVNRFTRL